MPFFETLQKETDIARQYVLSAPVIPAVVEGRFDLAGYRYFLEQAFHHVRHTVPLMMACGAHLPPRLEHVRKALVEYIEEEYGHDEWILNDFEICGGNKQQVCTNTPCLPIELMVAFLYDQINRGNPMAFFGMVMVLEGTSIKLATQMGRIVQSKLDLPDNAFSYLFSHGHLDLDHFQFFETLMNTLEDPDDQRAIIHAAKVVYQLYGDMLRTVPVLQTTSGEVQHAAA